MIRGRATWSSRGTKAAAFLGPIVAMIAMTAMSTYKACHAADAADDAKAAAVPVPEIAKEAAKTDVELDAAYKALLAKVTDIETRLDAALKREVLLEQLVLEVSRRHPATQRFRERKVPVPVAKGPPLPSDPAAAAVQMPPETIRIDRGGTP